MILLNYWCCTMIKNVERKYAYVNNPKDQSSDIFNQPWDLYIYVSICLMKCVIAFLSGRRTVSICIAPSLWQQFGYNTYNCHDKMDQGSQILLLQAGNTVNFRDLLAISTSNFSKNLSILTQSKMLIRLPTEMSFWGILFVLFLLVLVQTDFGH